MSIWMRRVLLFLALNLLVVLTLSFLIRLLGLDRLLTQHGFNAAGLLVLCFIWGMGGAFISLLLSKTMARWVYGVQTVEMGTRDPTLRKLIQMVERLSKEAGLPVTPEIGVYQNADANAFATGPTRKRSLVAVSTGLLNRMDEEALEGVIGHELAHIANGDMVTMTLLQGVINAFVMFLARALAYLIVSNKRDSQRGGSAASYYMLTFLFEFVFMLFGSLLIAAYSRRREFRADAGGAAYAGRGKMIAALEALERLHHKKETSAVQSPLQTLQIFSFGKLLHLFATHPPIEKRIARLKGFE